MIGQIIDDRYEVLEVIGKGSMGTVYRAQHVKMARPVAIKVLRSKALQNHRARGRFLREAKVASVLKHRNSVLTHDFGETPAGPYLVMELLEGKSLADRIADDGPIPPAEAARIARCIANALSEAHGHGIVHRDLKPANVFLHSEDGQEVVKVVDFGIAKFTAPPPLPEKKPEGKPSFMYETTMVPGIRSVVGTAAYISPEQVAGDRIDGRADLYALGGVLFTMLTGQPPFAGRPEAVMQMHLSMKPPRLPDSVPRPLRKIVEMLLEKRRDARPRHARIVAEMLRPFVPETELSAPAIDVGIRPRPWAKMGLAALAVLSIGALAYALSSIDFAADEPPPEPRLRPTTGIGAATSRTGWKHIAAGLATIGSGGDDATAHPSESPRHRVLLTRSFLMKRTEVTRGDWIALMRHRPATTGECETDDCPVGSVTWWDALAFCNALSKTESRPACYTLLG